MTTVTSPLTGRVLSLAAVPDPVFADGLLGDGIAIDPVREPTTAVAPIAGVVVSLHSHAFVIVEQTGRAVLTHLGIDTVKLKAYGSEQVVAVGDRLGRGQPVIRWNPATVQAQGLSPICSVVALDTSAGDLTSLVMEGAVSAGTQLFVWA